MFIQNFTPIHNQVRTRVDKKNKNARARAYVPCGLFGDVYENRIDASESEQDKAFDIAIERIERVKVVANDLYRKPSPAQRRFLSACITAAIPIIVTNFEPLRRRISAHYRIKEFRTELLAQAPRRIGKTTMLCILFAALMIVVPDMWISIFSPGKRTSSALLNGAKTMILEYMTRHPELDIKVSLCNQEKIIIVPTDGTQEPDGRRLCSYPASKQGAKGAGAKVIAVDEAALVAPEFLEEVVFPLFGVNDTLILLISTPLNLDDIFTTLLTLRRENGTLFFHVVEIRMRCDECKKANVQDCKHRMGELPSWKSSKRQQDQRILMSQNPALYYREVCGEIGMPASPLLSPDDIRRFIDRPRIYLTENCTRIFTCIDPSGGGPSHLAIISMIVQQIGDRSMYVIIAMDSKQVKPEEHDDFVLRHLKMIRDVAIYRDATIVLQIESNLGLEASSLHREIKNAQEFEPVMSMMEGNGHGRMGVRTGPGDKFRFVTELRRRLRADRIGISADLITQSTLHQSKSIVSELQTQMLRFRENVTIEGPKDNPAFQRVKKSWSGKVAGMNDDLCMVLLMNVYWTAFFFDSPTYVSDENRFVGGNVMMDM